MYGYWIRKINTKSYLLCLCIIRASFFFDKRWHKDDLQSSKCKDGRTLASDLLWCFSLLVDLTEGLKCRRDLSRSYHPFTRAHLSLSPARKWSFSMAMALVICRMHWSSNDLNTNFVYVSEVSFPTNYLKNFILLLVQQNLVDVARWGCVNVQYMKCATVPASFSVVLTPLHKLTVDGVHKQSPIFAT